MGGAALPLPPLPPNPLPQMPLNQALHLSFIKSLTFQVKGVPSRLLPVQGVRCHPGWKGLSLPHIEGPPWPRDIEGGTCVRGPKPRPAIPVFPGEFSMCCAWASIPDLVHTDHVLTPRGLSSAFAEVPSLSSTSSKIRSYLRVFICVFIISGPIPLTVRIIDQHDLTIHLTDKK